MNACVGGFDDTLIGLCASAVEKLGEGQSLGIKVPPCSDVPILNGIRSFLRHKILAWFPLHYQAGTLQIFYVPKPAKALYKPFAAPKT